MPMTRACPTPNECSVVLDLRAENERLRAALTEISNCTGISDDGLVDRLAEIARAALGYEQKVSAE